MLPYLEVVQGNEDEIEQIEEVEVPDITGKTVNEAEKILKKSGLGISIENDSEELDKETEMVKEQTPKPGIVVNKESKVYIKN